jgi:hypothetical protein
MGFKTCLHKLKIINFFNNSFNAIFKPIGADFVLYTETDRIFILKSFITWLYFETGAKALVFLFAGKAESRHKGLLL